ncbi:hypothetical protein D3C86_1925580 [compost metagenome]
MSASTPAAIICPKSTENFETKVNSPTGNVALWLPEISISANSNSLHAAVKTKPSVAAMPGNVSGRMIWRNAVKRLAPSIIAASSRSFGIPSKKDCMRKVAKGTLKAV